MTDWAAGTVDVAGEDWLEGRPQDNAFLRFLRKTFSLSFQISSSSPVGVHLRKRFVVTSRSRLLACTRQVAKQIRESEDRRSTGI